MLTNQPAFWYRHVVQTDCHGSNKPERVEFDQNYCNFQLVYKRYSVMASLITCFQYEWTIVLVGQNDDITENIRNRMALALAVLSSLWSTSALIGNMKKMALS